MSDTLIMWQFTLIEKIVIHEATKGADGMRDQEIEIYYRFIGKID